MNTLRAVTLFLACALPVEAQNYDRYAPPPAYPPGPLGQPGPYGLQPAQPYSYGPLDYQGVQPSAPPSLQPQTPPSEFYAEDRFQRQQERLQDQQRQLDILRQQQPHPYVPDRPDLDRGVFRNY